MYKCITALLLTILVLLPTATQSVTIRNGYKKPITPPPQKIATPMPPQRWC